MKRSKKGGDSPHAENDNEKYRNNNGSSFVGTFFVGDGITCLLFEMACLKKAKNCQTQD